MMKKIFFFTILLFSASSIKAQDYDFEKLKSEVDSKVFKNQWDEILLIAPDLLIANPEKGDGYYYSALAFFKLELKDKANIYIKKAELFADNELIKKINKLKNEIKEVNALESNRDLAKKLQDNNDLLKAAEYWKNTWVLNKSNLEYGLNAVDLFIKHEKYSQALEILNDDVFKNESDAFLIIDKLNKTPEVIYKKSINKGDNYFNNNNFYEAIKEYEKALRADYKNIFANKKLRDAKEEYSWVEAKKVNSVNYIKEYIKKYPQGKYLDKAKKNIADNLFSKANNELKDKEWKSSVNSFYEFIDYSLNGKKIKLANSSIKKANKRLKRRSFGFIAGVYEFNESLGFFNENLEIKDEKFGLTFGKLNHKGLGWYSNIRLNINLINDAKLDFKEKEIILSNLPMEYNQANGSLTLGTSFPILYPVWLYAGAGVNYREYYTKNDLDDEIEFFSIESEEFLRFFPEAGIMFRLGGFILSGGASYLDDEFIYQGSFGFSF